MTDTHCPYCALQCAMTLTATPGERLPAEVAGRDFPTNRGGLCKKGWTSAELLGRADRITAPLVKQSDGTFVEAAWEEVLDRIAAAVARLKAESGPDAIGVFGGGGLTNEKAYQLGKFARIALGTRLIDYNGRFCMSSAAAAANRALASTGAFRSRSRTSTRRMPCSSSGRTWATPCRRSCSTCRVPGAAAG